MLNAYPAGYPLPGDIKFTSPDRGYEYMNRNNGLGTSMLNQSMAMGASANMEYKYASNQLQQDASTGNSQPILTPPPVGDEASSSITNHPPSSFTYSNLPSLSATAGNATSLDYYSTANPGFLTPAINGASMTHTERPRASLHMPPLSPPYNYAHNYSPYSLTRPSMPDYSHFSAQRSGTYDPFYRSHRAVSSLVPFASSMPPFTPSVTQQPQPRNEGPPFDEMQKAYSLFDAQHRTLTYDIVANIPKGFFTVDGKWTCYRRNYFNVSCGFTVKSPHIDGQIYLQRHPHSNLEQITGFAVSIAARTAPGNSVESEARGLVQHTPKRDKATESIPGRHIVSPIPASSLNSSHGMTPNGIFPPSHITPGLASGLEPFSHATAQAPQTTHSFERIQFQKATANNGKRRAQQQYFHVVVKLEASVQRPGGQEEWLIIASKQSAQMVVRGRSPGHYKDTRRDSQSSMDPDGGPGHHGEGSGLPGFSLHTIGSSHSSGFGSVPGSYRPSPHHYGTSFNNSRHRAEDSETPSASPGSSGTLASSPIRGDVFRPIQQMTNSAHPDACINRVALSALFDKPDANAMDFECPKKAPYEDEDADHYFQSSYGTTYNNPSFDFSATSSQALCV